LAIIGAEFIDDVIVERLQGLVVRSRLRHVRSSSGGLASIPDSLRCCGVMGEGASVSGSTPPPDFGNAMTSRIESVPASSATIRSQPNAIPPCGGAPKGKAPSKNPNFPG